MSKQSKDGSCFGKIEKKKRKRRILLVFKMKVSQIERMSFFHERIICQTFDDEYVNQNLNLTGYR